MMSVLVGSPVVTAGTETEVDRSVLLQAAFLHRIVGFVDWPDEERAVEFTIGVLGDDPFGDVLETVFADPGRDGEPVTIARATSADSLLHCSLVYIALDHPGDVTRALRVLKSRPILTVAHQPGFAAQGGHVNFYVEDERLRFEVNLDAVHAAQLRMSSRLLALARIVDATRR